VRNPLDLFRNTDRLDDALAAIEHNGNGNGHERAYASTALARVAKSLVPAGGTVGVQNAWCWYDETQAGGPGTNPELAGRLKYAAYREMALTDPAVRSLYFMWKLPIRSAEYKVESADNHPAGQAAAENEAEFARWQLGPRKCREVPSPSLPPRPQLRSEIGFEIGPQRSVSSPICAVVIAASYRSRASAPASSPNSRAAHAGQNTATPWGSRVW
jgi:hypothetical protein